MRNGHDFVLASRCRASSGGPWQAAPPPASMHCLDAMAPPVTTPGGSWPCLALARRLSPPGRLGGPRPEDPRRSPPIGHPQGKLAARPTTASSRPYDTPKNPQAVKFPGYLIFRQPWLAGSVLHRGSHNSWSRRTCAAALGHRARTRHAPGSPFPAARGARRARWSNALQVASPQGYGYCPHPFGSPVCGLRPQTPSRARRRVHGSLLSRCPPPCPAHGRGSGEVKRPPA